MHVKAVSLNSSHGDMVGIAEQAGRQAGSKVVRIESAALQPRHTCWQICQHHVLGIIC